MRGDPIFDSFYASQMQSQANVVSSISYPSRVTYDLYTHPMQTMSEANNRNAGAALFDKIGEAILITHSQGGIYGWGIGDMRPDAVKGILSIEPEGPPFEGKCTASNCSITAHRRASDCDAHLSPQTSSYLVVEPLAHMD